MPGLVLGIPIRTARLCLPKRDGRDNPSHDNSFFGFVMRNKQKRDSTPPGGGSQRQLRVGELVRHAMAEMLTRGDVHDPVIEGHLITVPEVRMSPDLRLATIYVMPLGGKDEQEVVAALERIEKFLRTPEVRRDLESKPRDDESDS